MSKSDLNLAVMAQGAFMEQFSRELDRVLNNIADPNTDPTKKRKVVLTAVIKADEDRDIALFEVQTKSTLIPAKPIITKIILDQDNDGSVVGAELMSGQKGQLFIDPSGEIKDDKGHSVRLVK